MKRTKSISVTQLVAIFITIPVTCYGQTHSRQEITENNRDYVPKLIHQPQNILLPLNKPHTIECPVEAKPEAQVKWFKDNELLISQPTHLEQTGSELMFFNVLDDDMGDYHCEATNYLGSIKSDQFKIQVQSSVHDPRISLEPRQAKVGLDQQVEFVCTVPLLGQEGSLALSRAQQHSQGHSIQEVEWRRNGRRLSVEWLAPEDSGPNPSQGSGPEWGDEIKSRFLARQLASARNGADNFDMKLQARPQTIQFALTILKAQLRDDNSTFTCLTKFARAGSDAGADDDGPASGSAAIAGEQTDSSESLAHESNVATVRVFSEIIDPISQGGTNSNNNNNVKLDVNLGPPIDNLVGKNPYELQYHTTQLLDPNQSGNKGGPIQQQPGADAALLRLFELVKPALMVLGCLFLLIIIFLLQFIYFKRRNEIKNQNRYVKHCGSTLQQQYSISSQHSNGSSSNDSSNGLAAASYMVDPVLSSLMGRTLSASVAGNQLHHQQAQRQLSGSTNQINKKYKSYRDQLRKVAATNDYLDGNFMINLANEQQEQQPFFIQTTAAALPNLYNQSLAAREQARGLLQAQNDHHVRSLSNLNNKQQFTVNNDAANGQILRNQQQNNTNGSHLNLPHNFLFNNQWSQQQQHNISTLSANNEHYQLVNCSSISPSSASSMTGSQSSSTGRLQSQARQPGTNETIVSTNHYSTIENNEDEDVRYEEVHCNRVQSNAQQSSGPNGKKIPAPILDGKVSNLKATNDQGQSHKINANQQQPFNRFSGKNRSGSGNNNGGESLNDSLTISNSNSRNQDQLSPYAVSSICGNIPQQPPMNSEAMKALCEQFDINQLMLLDGPTIKQFDQPPPPPPPDEESTNNKD